MRFFRSFRDDRALVGRSGTYADALMREPSAEEAEWLGRAATRGDGDHARWELRYLRRALGILVAQRDALDDRTHAQVLRALVERMERDPNVDAELRELAARQFNARLSAYRDAFALRGHGTPATRVAQNLLAFSGGPIRATDPVVQHGAALVTGYLDSANEALRAAFGTVDLPPDAVPSTLAASRR